MQHKLILILILSLNFVLSLSSQSLIQAIAILDFTPEVEDKVDSRLFSAEHMVKVTGVPYVITTTLEEAIDYSFILLSTKVTNANLSDTQDSLLKSYVKQGGILLAPSMENENLYPLFGIDSHQTSTNHFSIEWNIEIEDKARQWIDEPEELIISLGRPSLNGTIKTYAYSTETAEAMAFYEDGSVAVTSNQYGQGVAISIGLSWKDVILRNQINRDYEAQRITSNGFEPSSDVFALYLRGLFLQYNQHAVWIHSSPANSTSTLIVTHDVDSQSAMDHLNLFVDLERDKGIEATYNITTRYFNDALTGAFYLNSEENMDYIKNNEQAFGSHSVGHFFDYADEDIFPLGTTGNTPENYQPYNDGTITSGGTIYGECEVSKNILETDLDLPINFFRTGHLAFPKKLIEVLDDLGYLYNSSISASDVLTNFPYQNVTNRSFSGKVSSVYELPVTISDVFHHDDIEEVNYAEKVDQWLEITKKTMNNGAPTVLLIHPNRPYKVDALKEYLERIPTSITSMEISKYGDFWKAREAYQIEPSLNSEEGILQIQIKDDLNEDLSFICSNGQLLNNIIILDKNGMEISFTQEQWNDQDILIYFKDLLSSNANIETQAKVNLKLFPNPTSEVLYLNYESKIKEDISVELKDINGNHILDLFKLKPGSEGQELYKSISNQLITPGTYFVNFQSQNGPITSRKIIII